MHCMDCMCPVFKHTSLLGPSFFTQLRYTRTHDAHAYVGIYTHSPGSVPERTLASSIFNFLLIYYARGRVGPRACIYERKFIQNLICTKLFTIGDQHGTINLVNQ